MVEVLSTDKEAMSIDDQIFKSMAEIFDESQSTYAGHRRNIALLKKIQVKAKTQGFEDAFNFIFCKLTTKVLTLKKTNTNGDRIVKLIAGFIASWERHVIKLNHDLQNDMNEESVSFSSFLNKFMRYILRGIENKNRVVRYRVTQLVAIIMDNISEIDEELFDVLSWAVSKRVYDSEPNVRAQAIFSVAKFQREDPDVINEPIELADGDWNSSDDVETAGDDIDATKMLIKIMRNDTNPEARRAAMLNLVQNEKTLPYILERVRDSNSTTRKLIYSNVLNNMNNIFEVLEKSVLDKLILWGLDDREPVVRKACIKLVTDSWLNMVSGDLVQLLIKLDVVKSKIAERILEQLLETRPDVVDELKFPREMWDNFTPETAFLLKCFHKYCSHNKLDTVIDENFLETVEFVTVLSKYINKGILKSDSESMFVSKQLLEIAVSYDFSDEVGRRDMLNLVRNLVYSKDLDDECIELCIGVLHTLAINEKDFINMTIEIVQDIRDESLEVHENNTKKNLKKRKRIERGLNEDEADEFESDEDEDEEAESALESFASAVNKLVETGETTTDEPLTDGKPVFDDETVGGDVLIRCLTLSRYMLELVSEKTASITFSSLIETLITPAVRNTEPEIRNLGVRNLGLCCLLDVSLASENMYILGMCASKGNESLKEVSLKAIVDIFSVHGTKVVNGEGKVDLISVHKIFYKILKNTEIPQCQAIAAEGLCKLFLGNVISDDDLFETLILSYFSPANQDNEPLMQAFAFGLPVYCYSHADHQEKMCTIATDVFFRLAILWSDLKKGEAESGSMLKPNVIFQQLIHWTDPHQVVNQTESDVLRCNYQLEFLNSLLEIYERFDKKDIKKMILLNINKFYICKEKDLALLRKIRESVTDILDNDDINILCKNSLHRFLKTLNEAVEENMKENNITEQDLNENSWNKSLSEDESSREDESLDKSGSYVGNDADLSNISVPDGRTGDSMHHEPSIIKKTVDFVLPNVSDEGIETGSSDDYSE